MPCGRTAAPGPSTPRPAWSSSTRRATARSPPASRCTGRRSPCGAATSRPPPPTRGRASSLTPASDDLTRAAAGALGGLASWSRGDLAGAEAAYVESVVGLHRAGFVADVLGCCIALGDIRRTLGRPGDAEHLYRWALGLADPAAPLRGTADMHVALAGRPDRTRRARRGRRAPGHGPAPGRAPRAAAEPLPLAGGRGAAARGSGATSTARSRCSTRPNASTTATTRRTWRPCPRCAPGCASGAASSRDAEAWARERRLSPDDELTYLREYEHITLARLLLARRRRRRRPRRSARPAARGGRGGRTGRERPRDPRAAGARRAGPGRRPGRPRGPAARPRARGAGGRRPRLRRRGAADRGTAPDAPPA